MAIDNNTNTLLRDLVLDVKAQEPTTRQKANTVTSVIGTALTTIATVATYLLQSGLDLSPSVTVIVAIIGMVATDFAVSKTKNGVTESIADKLELELARRIDLTHDHDDQIMTASEESSTSTVDATQLRAEAESLSADNR